MELKNKNLAKCWKEYISTDPNSLDKEDFQSQFNIQNIEFGYAMDCLNKLETSYCDSDLFFQTLFTYCEKCGTSYHVATLLSDNLAKVNEIHIYWSSGRYYLKEFKDGKMINISVAKVFHFSVIELLECYYQDKWKGFKFSHVWIDWSERKLLSNVLGNDFKLLGLE